MNTDLQARLLAGISEGAPAIFDELVLDVFIFQYERNAIYRAYCDRQGCSPTTVRYWKQVPAVPTGAFKDFAIACFPVERAAAEFHTSGTTAAKAGKHYLPTTELYDAAIRPNFAAHLLPDGARLSMMALTPSPEESPHSSLSHMTGVVLKEFGGTDSNFYIHDGTLQVEQVVRALRRAQTDRQPVFLLGTAFAFVHLFDACASKGLRIELAAGSRAMETGGFKGRSREMSKREVYGLFERYLAIPSARIVNEYGMTELSTQFYDNTIRLGHASDIKTIPPWARVLIIDPHTGAEAAPGHPGLVRVFDLANLWSALCIQTEDLGVARDEGFEIIGRATGAEVRGCSLNAEDLKLA